MDGSNGQPKEFSAPSSVPGADPVSEIPGIEDIDEVKSLARSMLQRGSVDFEDLIETVTDHFEAGEDAMPGITDVAESVLRELISQQAQWPEDEMADMKMLMEAFEVLEQKGVISRANFSCCSRCGNGEIHGEASSHHVGYCYFHEQDLDRCIEDGRLDLRHGVIGDDFADLEKRAEIARKIIETMEDVGLATEWNEDPETVIHLRGFKWRVRLHDSTHDGNDIEGEESGDEDTDDEFLSLDTYVR
ncbi:hypothetical protein ACLOAV_002784 [Pseudogymnoascus australis]